MSLLRNFVGRRRILLASSPLSLPQPILHTAATSLISRTLEHSRRDLQNMIQVNFISQYRPMERASPTSTDRLPASSETLLITEKCKQRLKEILEADSFLRISVEGGGCSGFQYKFEIDKNLEADDVILTYSEEEKDKTLLVIDKTSLNILKGSTVDYETELIRSAFKIVNNPQAEHGCSCGSSFNVKID